MRAEALRCTAPHPSIPGWVCRARLVDAVPGTVDLEPGDAPPPGGIGVVCPRCGARYVARERAAA